MGIDLEKQIIEWLLNGVTFREIQERCGWLGHPITEEEILKIQEKFAKHNI